MILKPTVAVDCTRSYANISKLLNKPKGRVICRAKSPLPSFLPYLTFGNNGHNKLNLRPWRNPPFTFPVAPSPLGQYPNVNVQYFWTNVVVMHYYNNIYPKVLNVRLFLDRQQFFAWLGTPQRQRRQCAPIYAIGGGSAADSRRIYAGISILKRRLCGRMIA